jgi:triacylglycerol lipase
MSFLTKLPWERYSADAFDSFNAARDFTLGNGKAMAWMSQLAYETDEPNKIADVLGSWGLQLVDGGILVKEVKTVLPIATTHCFVASGRGATIVAFAGTDPIVLANWITDFDAHIDETETAEGYQIAADAVWPQLENSISAPGLGSNKIVVTRHSLGGALAALSAHHIDSDRVAELAAVYTFGMPRPSNKEFADNQYNPNLGSRTYRLVQGDDLAPTELGFHHLGRYLHCEQGRKFDASDLAADTRSDDPQFVAGIAKELTDLLHGPLSGVLSAAAQLQLAQSLAFGQGPPDARTDPGGILIELLPPRLRDHMPDRYIGGF